jgi:hypothetical protein
VQGQAALVDLRMRIDQVQTSLAMGGTTREQNQLAVTQLQVLYARADDANTNIMVAALSAAMPAVPTHTPVAAPTAPAHTEERQAEAMLS